MKDKNDKNIEELQNLDIISNDLEWDRLFRIYLHVSREEGFGLVSYSEYHILNKASIITEGWILNEIRIQKEIATQLSKSISFGLIDALNGFRSWMKGRRREKIEAVLNEVY